MSTPDSSGAPAREPPSARVVAARVVERTLHAAVFLSDALDQELGRSPLSTRDRALATELAYGAVRLERPLLQKLQELAPRGVAKGDTLAQAHLLVAAYQILALDRVPAFAAVSEAVESLSRLRAAKVAGFANAVLRRLTAEREGFSLTAALEASVEPWLFQELERAVGREAALGLLGASLATERRGLCVRFVERAAELPEWVSSAEPGTLAPRAYWLSPRGDLRNLPGYGEGAFVVQEEGAQWAALALGARAGERVLDACAGHGQKSSLIAERLGAQGSLWVNDTAAAKLDRLQREFERLCLPAPRVTRVDLIAGTGELPNDFDRVLVDAPCTGTGTLRRRPEIAKRLTPEDAGRLGERARAILRNAASHAKIGGRVVYVVCSVLRAECEEVAESVRDVLQLTPFDAPEAVRLLGPDASECRLLPSVHGTDGYYVASALSPDMP